MADIAGIGERAERAGQAEGQLPCGGCAGQKEEGGYLMWGGPPYHGSPPEIKSRASPYLLASRMLCV